MHKKSLNRDPKVQVSVSGELLVTTVMQHPCWAVFWFEFVLFLLRESSEEAAGKCDRVPDDFSEPFKLAPSLPSNSMNEAMQEHSPSVCTVSQQKTLGGKQSCMQHSCFAPQAEF